MGFLSEVADGLESAAGAVVETAGAVVQTVKSELTDEHHDWIQQTFGVDPRSYGNTPAAAPQPADPPPAAAASAAPAPSVFDRVTSAISTGAQNLEASGAALVQTAEKEASALVKQAETAGSAVIEDVKTIGAEAVTGLENAGSTLAGSLNINPSMLSDSIGGALGGPSYNNQPVPQALQGGGTASAGDSTFVTGDQKSALFKRATDLRAAATGIRDAEAAIEKQASGSDGPPDAKKVLQSVKNMKTVADGLLNIAKAIESLVPGGNDEALAAAGKTSKAGDQLIQAADTLLQIQSTNNALKAFQDHPSEATAKAWARGVGDIFGSVGAYVPTEGIPGFIADYWKGLLTAPKNYIDAFIVLQDVYYGNIDKEAGIFQDDAWLGHNGKRVSDGSWAGDLTDIYTAGWFSAVDENGKRLSDYMIAHRKTEGADLWKVTVAVGKAMLLTAVNRDIGADDLRNSWIALIDQH